MKQTIRRYLLLTLALLLPAAVLARRQSVTPNDSDLPDNLRVVRTRHYELHTDLDDALVKDLIIRMDAMYDEYARRMSDFKPDKDAPPLPVYLFNRERDYRRLTKGRGVNSGGMFVGGPTSFLSAFLESQGRDTLRRTLQHEAFHQFAYSTISADLPIWVNEGLAQLFEEGIWTGDHFWLGQVPPRRVRQLQDDIKHQRMIPFDKLLAMTSEEWGRRMNENAEDGATQYNQAWAMVQFLAEGPNPDYRKRLLSFLKKLHEGEGADAAFKSAFSDNIKGFQDRFSEWAVKLQATPEATLMERQETLGDLLIALGSQGRQFRAMSAFRGIIVGQDYQMTYTRGSVRWKTSDTPQIYFSDLDGRLYSQRDLYFEPRNDAPLPDIVCHCTPQILLRTHFYRMGAATEHEVLVETQR